MRTPLKKKEQKEMKCRQKKVEYRVKSRKTLGRKKSLKNKQLLTSERGYLLISVLFFLIFSTTVFLAGAHALQARARYHQQVKESYEIKAMLYVAQNDAWNAADNRQLKQGTWTFDQGRVTVCQEKGQYRWEVYHENGMHHTFRDLLK